MPAHGCQKLSNQVGSNGVKCSETGVNRWSTPRIFQVLTRRLTEEQGTVSKPLRTTGKPHLTLAFPTQLCLLPRAQDGPVAASVENLYLRRRSVIGTV